MELLAWRQSLSIAIPTSSSSEPQKSRFAGEDLRLPSTLAADRITGYPTARSPRSGAISIEVGLLSGERESFGALGIAFIGYALSEQKDPFRLHLSHVDSGLTQLVIWPCEDSSLEAHLGFRQRIYEAHYRPALPKDNPNYTTVEQDDPEYPREHLPYCRFGAADVEGGGITRKGEAVCLHFKGTGPSLIWIGKYLLNFSLSDNRANLASLYNFDPAESMRRGSAELRLTISNSGKPELFPPHFLDFPYPKDP